MTFAMTLDRWAQDEAFVAAQERQRLRYTDLWLEVEHALVRAADELGRFSAEDVVDRVEGVGRAQMPPNLIGSVIGALRSAGRIRVVGRQRSRHREARGRWINTYEVVPP